MIPLGQLVLIVGGFALLAVSMRRHQGAVFSAPLRPLPARAMQAGGWLLLVVSAIPAGLAANVGIGVAAWLGWLTVGALAIVSVLTALSSR